MFLIGYFRSRHGRRQAEIRERRQIFVLMTGIFCTVLAALTFFHASWHPRIEDAVYRMNGGQFEPFTFPLRTPEGRQNIDVSFALNIGAIHPDFFRIIPDNCLIKLSVNGQALNIPQTASCAFSEGIVFDFSPILRPGRNTVTMQVDNTGGFGSVRFSTDRAEPLLIFTLLSFILIMFVYGCCLSWFFRLRRATTIVLLIASLGILIRVAYFSITPIDVRGHDYDGHWNYIEYVAKNFTIPPIHGDKLFYHPPLYYFTAAPIYSLANITHRSIYTLAKLVQSLSLAYSIIALLLGLWVVSLFYPPKKNLVPFALASLVLATLPSLVFFAARINNDALYQVFAFACVGLLVRWWQKGLRRDWYLLVVAFSLGMLTKSNMMLFAPLIGALLMFRKRTKPKAKFQLLAVGAVLCLLLTGWYQVPRLAESENSRVALVGNVREQVYFAPMNPAAFLTFNPVAILQHPFNDPFYDVHRRMNFWEYFFRSAFYGEFKFEGPYEPLGRLIILCGLLLLIPVLVRLIADMFRRTRTMFPLWFSFLTFLSGALIFRLFFPFFSSQDFRYSLPLLLPVVIYAVREKNGKMMLRWHQRIIIGLLCIGNVAFLAVMYCVE